MREIDATDPRRVAMRLAELHLEAQHRREQSERLLAANREAQAEVDRLEKLLLTVAGEGDAFLVNVWDAGQRWATDVAITIDDGWVICRTFRRLDDLPAIDPALPANGKTTAVVAAAFVP